ATTASAKLGPGMSIPRHEVGPNAPMPSGMLLFRGRWGRGRVVAKVVLFPNLSGSLVQVAEGVDDVVDAQYRRQQAENHRRPNAQAFQELKWLTSSMRVRLIDYEK